MNNDIKHAKEEHYKTAFCENEKNLKSIINEMTSRKQTSSLVKEVKRNDKTCIDLNQIWEVFNEHFASIGPKLAEEISVNVTGHSHLDDLTIQNHEHSFNLKRPIYPQCFPFCLSYVNLRLLAWKVHLPSYFVFVPT